MDAIDNLIYKRERMGWMLIGELESGDKCCLPTESSDMEPFFLYMRFELGNDDNPIYRYSITKGILKIGHFDDFEFPKRYSINTILCSYISVDRDYGRLSNGNHLMTKAEGFKIRLAGNKDWIEVDDDFLNGRINMDELELKFRTDKEEKWIDCLKKREYFKEDASQEMLKTYKIPL